MIDPADGLAALLTKLKDIPSLVALIGSADNISSYVSSYPITVNRLLAIQAMKPPAILVACLGTLVTNRSRGIAHQYAAYLKPNGSPFSVFRELRDGIVTASGQKLKITPVMVECDPPDIQGCFERTFFITEQSSIDYHEVPIVLTERGADI